MTITLNLAHKEVLVYLPKHIEPVVKAIMNGHTCTVNGYLRRRVFITFIYLLFNYVNVINCQIISDFWAVLFPVDLVTKRAIIGCGQKSIFSSLSQLFP